MGNQQVNSKPENSNENKNSFEHPHLGLIQNPSDQRFADSYLKVYHFADQMMGQQKLRRFNARVKKFGNSQYILSIKSVSHVPKHQMCANNSDVNLHFQKYSCSLNSILSNRIKEKKMFTQQQIYQFINQVLQALIFLQDNGFKNCQLDKQSIVYSSGKIKLLDMGIATNTPYQTFLDKMQPVQGFYIAPQLLKDLKQKNYQPYLSPKSDVFCLGMIILQLACMQPLDSYYNFQDFSIDYQSLIHRVSKIVYSVELKTLIAGMLQFQSDLRLGLITAQQKVRKYLHLDTLQNLNGTTKRSRSSSTKMLKELLTNSRRTITASQKQSDRNSLTKKPSSSSFSSVTYQNQNSKSFIIKGSEQNKVHNRKNSELYPSKQQTNFLKNLVRNKTQMSKTVTQVTRVTQKSQIQNNKQNINKLINKEIRIQIIQPQPFVKDNLKYLQQIRNQPLGSSTFLGSYSNMYQRKNDSFTPKLVQFTNKVNKQQSIFKLIQQDSSFKSSNTNNQTTDNVPDFSPVPPVVPKVPETNSINRLGQIVQHQAREVTEFDDQLKKEQLRKKIAELQSPQQSLSLRVKKSLDKMYKTTKSITSSEQKFENQRCMKNIYKKVELPNGYSYQGQVSLGDIFEGNGVLYDPKGRIIYSGSWSNGLYSGFGTIYNLQQVPANRLDFKNLENTKNWIRYEGEFIKGQREGFGTIYYSSGERFAGCMRNGQINGYGCFYNRSNQMTSGIWVNNRLQC